MSLLGGRGGRSDDWPSPHARALARAAERLDGPLEAAEDAWLTDHLAECGECAAAAADYAQQRTELRALRDSTPVPPRDLWARTAAAIEREAASGRGQGRRGRSLQSLLAPYALLTGALLVAVAVGSISIWKDNRATPQATTPVAAATPGSQPTVPGATPILVNPGSVAYLTKGDGKVHHLDYTHVCGPSTEGCETSGSAGGQSIGPLASPETVFGAAGDGPLVVVTRGNGSGGKVYAVPIATQSPDTSPTPSEPPSSPVAPSPSSNPTPSASATPPGSTPPSEPPGSSPPPSSEPASPPPSANPDGAVEIAHDLTVLDSTAAYSRDGTAFAFTARPSDGSHGPDIYVWRVGDPEALAVTTDHRSVFGSWSGDTIVGSTVTASPDGTFDRPLAFILRPGDATPTLLTETGRAWRPVVDPTGRTAIYWSGGLEPTADGLGWTTTEGRLVVGRWEDVAVGATSSAAASQSPTPSADVSPTVGPTAPPDADQPAARQETTIEAGPLVDWDARWDETGTRLAVWVADKKDPTVGKLSLYVVDAFDGKIDQASRPLADEPALAGFAMTNDHLAWAAPPAAGSAESRVQVLAWTASDFGKVQSTPGDIILIR